LFCDGEQNGLCIRGLEKISRSRRRANSHVRAILKLQKEHRNTRISDPKGVSMLSKTLSKSDRRLAALFGSVDRKEVNRIWKSEEKGSYEAVGSEYYQLSMAVLDQSTDAPILLNEGMRYSPFPDHRKQLGRENGKDTSSTDGSRHLQLCLLRRRVGYTSPREGLSTRAA
jgi:hypothetical protein